MKHLIWLFLIISGTVLIACTSDKLVGVDNFDEDTQATLDLYFTDAPIDNENIKSCYITIADVKLNGVSLEAYNRTTVDILKYNKGETYFVNQFELSSGTVNTVELILDDQVDESSDMPGCFIETFDGHIYSLNQEQLSVVINSDFELGTHSQQSLIIDFDLRKCILETGEKSAPYTFSSEANLSSAIRLSNEHASVIKGSCKELLNKSDKIVVYAYPKNAFNIEAEMSNQVDGNNFKNAANSASCNEDGGFELHFLDQGDYELYFMSYSKTEEGNFELQGRLAVDVVGSLDVLNLSLNARTTLHVNVLATGLLDL